MGWAYGHNSEGREIGYGVEATCDEPGCDAEIDRGLAYACGDEHGATEYSCGDYFCGKHTFYGRRVPDATDGSRWVQLCRRCYDAFGEEDDDEDALIGPAEG